MDRWIRVDDGDQPRPRSTVASTAASRGTRKGTGRGTEADRAARASAAAPARRGRPTEPQPLPADIATAIRRETEGATARHQEVVVGRMERAVAAYDHNRFQEAARLAGQVAGEAGQVPAVRRLAGFANYRQGRWREAVRQFEAFLALTEDAEVLPALMDCQRALGRHKAVTELWAELRRAAPDADSLAEGRIVAAGSLADRGDLLGAIEVLATAGAGRSLRNPSERHLRQWYALADLYERAGDVPRARSLFTRVALVDPDAFDVAERLASLGPERRSRSARPSRRGRATKPAEPQPGTQPPNTPGAPPPTDPGEHSGRTSAPDASGPASDPAEASTPAEGPTAEGTGTPTAEADMPPDDGELPAPSK